MKNVNGSRPKDHKRKGIQIIQYPQFMANFYKLVIFTQNSNICRTPQTKAMNRHSLFRLR